MNADASPLEAALCKLNDSWRRQGLALAPCLNESDVRDRFARLCREVAGDVVRLYTYTGGMLNEEPDDENFSLWPLDYAMQRNLELNSKHWLFADFLCESHFYLIVYQTPASSSVATVLDAGEEPCCIARTLEDFLVRYAQAASGHERFQVLHGEFVS